MENRKVHLVLGSGGARGLAHIGVIEVLEEKGFEIASVVGCSMGAVVGGLYAAGYNQAYKEWMLTLTRSSVFNLLDFTFTRQGFIKGEKVFNLLREVTGPQDIEHLKVPFTAVATDMLRNQEVNYTSGDLYKALRASIAIPGVFTPVLENGQFLVDGGVLNPLPLNLVRKKQGELVVAVNLNGPASEDKPMLKVNERPEAVSALWKWLQLTGQDTENASGDFSPLSDYSLRELLLLAYQMTQDRLTNLMLEVHPPDVLVEIPVNSCSIFEFHKAKSQIELGREICHRALVSLENY
ncbi:patatin-like phospholipase family protein [Pontibacter sp. HSC-36F09]|uniref:patatin-like phospholipase family protein n=1 Tax=Pontibacter sp. HSC-36F09 TaxID=2910966 RepID=UPI00209F7F5F|nr:patatin-like phospholipase family protein [Pontibacter sp. HSC-36F09]MCP2044325.1 NTE family protein [Pontibacter sp. HSC-36F09]